MNNKNQNKKLLIGVIALAVAIIVFAAIFFVFAKKPSKGTKNIVISVTDKAQNTISYELKTDAEYLKEAMEEADGLTFSGTEGPYGIMVETVNGETADMDNDGAYWAFYVNDEYCSYGVDSQPVYDGDRFGIVYTVYVAE